MNLRYIKHRFSLANNLYNERVLACNIICALPHKFFLICATSYFGKHFYLKKIKYYFSNHRKFILFSVLLLQKRISELCWFHRRCKRFYPFVESFCWLTVTRKELAVLSWPSRHFFNWIRISHVENQYQRNNLEVF